MQFSAAAKPPLGVIFDSSFGESIDSVLALALLHGFEGKNRARVAALSISKSNLKAAQLCDVVEKFYASATTGLAAAFLQGLPIGLAVDGKLPDDTPLLVQTLATKGAEQKPAYSPRIQKLNDTAIAEVLIRNALSAQHNQNAVIVAAGPASNLARLLSLAGAKNLITDKVKVLVIAGGQFPSGKPEPNFIVDIAAAKRVLAEWPTPIVMCGREIGDQLLFPGQSIEKDFAYAPHHPVADAYRVSRSMPYDAPSCAVAAMLHGIRSDDGYFRSSEPGNFSIGDDGQVLFQASPQSKHRYLILDPAQKDRVIQTYVEMASAKPVPRTFRRRQQQQEQQQQPQEKEKPAQAEQTS